MGLDTLSQGAPRASPRIVSSFEHTDHAALAACVGHAHQQVRHPSVVVLGQRAGRGEVKLVQGVPVEARRDKEEVGCEGKQTRQEDCQNRVAPGSGGGLRGAWGQGHVEDTAWVRG